MPDLLMQIFYDDETEEWVGEIKKTTDREELLFHCSDESFFVVAHAVASFLTNLGDPD